MKKCLSNACEVIQNLRACIFSHLKMYLLQMLELWNCPVYSVLYRSYSIVTHDGISFDPFISRVEGERTISEKLSFF